MTPDLLSRVLIGLVAAILMLCTWAAVDIDPKTGVALGLISLVSVLLFGAAVLRDSRSRTGE